VWEGGAPQAAASGSSCSVARHTRYTVLASTTAHSYSSSSSAGPASATVPVPSLPVRHFQNLLFSLPCWPTFSSSTVTTASAALHPSSFLCSTHAATSAERARSMTLENLPCQQNTWSGVTRTKQSPELRLAGLGGTSRDWQNLRPFTWISIFSL